MPRSSYFTSQLAYLTYLKQAPVEAVRTPNGSPKNHRWHGKQEYYVVPMNATIRMLLLSKGFIEYTKDDEHESPLERHIKGPYMRITQAGRDYETKTRQSLFG